MKRVYLVRHGQTAWNADDRIQGWTRVGLNETGKRQAEKLAAFLARSHPEIGLVASSDLPRALDTAKTIVATEPFTALSVAVDPAWRERNFGEFQGLDSSAFFEDHPEYSVLDHGTAGAERTPEGGESYAEFDARVVDAWTDFVATLSVDAACLVAHSNVVRQIRAHIEGLSYREAITGVDVANCSVTEIRLTGEGASVGYRNRDSFLSGSGTE